MATDEQTASDLEAGLGGLLDVEKFEPPPEFREQALIKDESVYEEARRDPLAWWEKQAEALDWSQRWEQTLDDSNPPFYKWFVGGKLNVSYNCLDRHVDAGLGDKVAYHWEGEPGDTRTITYRELLDDVCRFTNALRGLGVRKGDRVAIYMGMV